MHNILDENSTLVIAFVAISICEQLFLIFRLWKFTNDTGY